MVGPFGIHAQGSAILPSLFIFQRQISPRGYYDSFQEVVMKQKYVMAMKQYTTEWSVPFLGCPDGNKPPNEPALHAGFQGS
jgi:hypothetical protein